MRNSILFILISLPIYSLAQPKIGIVAGLNLPWQKFKLTTASGSLEVKYDMIASFHAGVVADFNISEKINFQPGLQVTGRGGKSKPNESNSLFKTENRLYYLEMPLIVNYSMPIRANRIFIGAGPSLAYGFSGKNKWTTYATFTNNAFENMFKRFDAGLRAQAGYRLKNIQATGTYNLGLINIHDNNNPDLPPGYTYDWRNNSLTFSVAYFFSFKK